MQEPPKRLPPRLVVRQRLFALSRNVCAFPGCQSPIIDANGAFVAQICHIEAAGPEGERFNPKQSNEDRRSFENLMLMCYPHHIATNDVEEYTVDVLRGMKAEHEKQAISLSCYKGLTDRFLDQSLFEQIALPSNLNQLDLSYCEPSFFSHAPVLLRRIAKLPQKTRSLYAHAFLRSIPGDLFLCFSPAELLVALGQSFEVLASHFDILERMGLIVAWDAQDDWRSLPIRGPRYYLSGLDSEDKGIWLLTLIHRRFRNDPAAILDLFENLNFAILER